jgi:hypothetical protein
MAETAVTVVTPAMTTIDPAQVTPLRLASRLAQADPSMDKIHKAYRVGTALTGQRHAL